MKSLLVLLPLFTVATASDVTSPHPKYRETFYPNRDSLVRANPFPFLWPHSAKKGTSYRFQLSRDADFSTIQVDQETSRAFYMPDQPLEGTWYWRARRSEGEAWSDPHQVTVPDDAVKLPAPPFSEVYSGIPKGHPRLLALPGEAEQLRERFDPAFQQEVAGHADRFLQTVIKPPDAAQFVHTDPKEKRKAINLAKGFLGQVQVQCVYLCKAYLLTGETRYAEAAIQRIEDAMNLPDEIIHLNDFTQGKLFDSLSYVFDTCYDQLTPEQRQQVITQMEGFASSFYTHFLGRLEAHIFDNHTWQKTYASFLRGTIALVGHSPDAEEWLHYAYDLWRARAPAGGFNHDGGWKNGNSYFTANIVTLIQVPQLWNRLSGMEAFAHPWFQHAPRAMLFTYPPYSYSNGFGDGHDSQTMPLWKRTLFMQMLAKELQDPLAGWYAEHLARSERGTKPSEYDPNAKHLLDLEAIQWFAELSPKPMPGPKAPGDLPQSIALPDTGVASLHTDLTDAEANIHVALRSSPFGSGSHTLANQNAFNLIAGGKPMFLSSGYYISFSDQHNLLHYRNTRGHNTVLLNGVGQSLGDHGFGSLRRYLDTPDLAYIMGDASHAYRGELRDPMWIRNFKNANVAFSEENGFGATRLERFHRHVVLLRSDNLVVIYDELRAGEPSVWNWLLHSPNAMILEEERGLLRGQASAGEVRGTFLIAGSTPLTGSLTDQYHAPADNWPGKKLNGEVIVYPNQHHLTVDSEPTSGMRFLTVMALDTKQPVSIQSLGKNRFQAGTWTITAAMDPEAPASLFLEGSEGRRFQFEGDGEVTAQWQVDGTLRKVTADILSGSSSR